MEGNKQIDNLLVTGLGCFDNEKPMKIDEQQCKNNENNNEN